jgi:hypothetical protein
VSIPVSGGYGLTLRIVFYVLAVVSILGRGHEWAVGAALQAVMIYSSTAAIHALILVGIRQQLAPSWLFPNYHLVLVEGQSPDGQYYFTDTTQQNAPLWLPIIPMAWDQDCDPTLLITSVAFLLLLPMYNFSNTLRKASVERQLIIVLWKLFSSLVLLLLSSARRTSSTCLFHNSDSARSTRQTIFRFRITVRRQLSDRGIVSTGICGIGLSATTSSPKTQQLGLPTLVSIPVLTCVATERSDGYTGVSGERRYPAQHSFHAFVSNRGLCLGRLLCSSMHNARHDESLALDSGGLAYV